MLEIVIIIMNWFDSICSDERIDSFQCISSSNCFFHSFITLENVIHSSESVDSDTKNTH